MFFSLRIAPKVWSQSVVDSWGREFLGFQNDPPEESLDPAMGGFEPVFERDSGPQNDATGFFGVWILDGQLLSK